VAIFYHYYVTKTYSLYILSNFTRTVLYTGVTQDLKRRMWQHKNNVVDGFTKRYKAHYLIYYEQYADPLAAIEREKQIKSWSRKKKDDLIKSMNPTLEDLYETIL
jgi:putative endonuclease